MLKAVNQQLADPRSRLELLRHRAAGRARRAAARPARACEGKVFFANSGAEANEAAFKLTRRTGRTHLVAMEGSFHGRTVGALALTSKAAYREPFEPLPGDVTFVPYGDVDGARRRGHRRDRRRRGRADPGGGRRGHPARRLPRRCARDRRRARRAAVARRGADRHGPDRHLDRPTRRPASTPDVVTLAKGLGGGIPIGAMVAVGEAGTLLGPGNHGTTFGGNPVAAAAALAVIETIEKDGLLDNATKVGELLRDGVEPRARHRGPGARPAHRHRPRRRGGAEGRRGGAAARRDPQRAPTGRIRLAPPLVLTEDQAEEFLALWPPILDEAYADAGGGP